MRPSLPPCPECGGERALFQCTGGDSPLSIVIDNRRANAVELYACTCLTCGHTTLLPDPEGMEKLRKAAKVKRKHF